MTSLRPRNDVFVVSFVHGGGAGILCPEAWERRVSAEVMRRIFALEPDRLSLTQNLVPFFGNPFPRRDYRPTIPPNAGLLCL